MTVRKRQNPVRICPVCSAADKIADDERLWPAGWRCASCGYRLATRAGIPSLAPELDGEHVGFDPAAFEALGKIEDGHFWFQVRNELIGWLLRRYRPDAERILEIGCGTGFTLRALSAACPGTRVTGIELHSAGLSIARGRHGDTVELIQADARQLCLREAVDVVCALDVLEHIQKDEAVLSMIEAALRPGGVLIAAVPQHPWLWSGSDDLAHHVRRYKLGEIERKVKAAGFELLFADSFVSLPLPALAISRLIGRIGKMRADRGKPAQTGNDPVSRELRVGPTLNRVMRGVLRLEHMLRRSGLRSPIGGSRVIVAQKRERTGCDPPAG